MQTLDIETVLAKELASVYEGPRRPVPHGRPYKRRDGLKDAQDQSIAIEGALFPGWHNQITAPADEQRSSLGNR